MQDAKERGDQRGKGGGGHRKGVGGKGRRGAETWGLRLILGSTLSVSGS